MTFGEAIRARREHIGMDQKEAARLICRSAQYLCDIEADRRGPPPDRIVMDLCGCLGLSYAYLTFLAGRIPSGMWEGLKATPVDPNVADAAWAAFARVMRGEQEVTP